MHQEGTLLTKAVRNPQGIFINSQVFREEALHFLKNGYYTPEKKGTRDYRAYWDEQLQRCILGYEVGGVKITQHHYFYLNFAPIKLAKQTGGRTAKKILSLPDFWDGDYAYFWAIEIARNGLFTDEALAPSTPQEKILYWQLEAERIQMLRTEENPDYSPALIKRNSDRRLALEEKVLDRLKLPYTIEVDWRDGGHHLLVGKARRKGYSYKNAALCTNVYNTLRGSLSLIGAFDKKYLYPRGTMEMASSYLSFLNKHTAWKKAREYVDRPEHKRASFKETTDGVSVEAGYLSEIMAVSFKDNPDAARGKDAHIVLLEEMGKFPNSKESVRATAPGLEAGGFITGQMIGFGTGGDMEDGTADFADMFYNPKQDNFMPFINIWDDDAGNSSCAFFHPVTWNMEGFYDAQGNSDIKAATEAEEEKRAKIIRHSTDGTAIQHHTQEWAYKPAEAFLLVSRNDFPIMELRNQYNRVVRDNLHLKYGQPVTLLRKEDKVVAIPDMNNIIQPLWSYKPKTSDYRGGVVIYEYPITNAPKGLYKIGFDPYRQQSSSATLPSMAAIYVYKCRHKGSFSRDVIVAQYVGRPSDPNDVNRIAEYLAELYNAEIMYENEVTHVKDYFIRKKKTHLMAVQPDTVISRLVNASKVNRTWGVHMVDKIKDGGEKYIKEWLLEVRDYDENDHAKLGLETIYDPALLEELILYNRKGNFDRVMAFMMIMLQLADEEEDKIYEDKKEHTAAKELLAMMSTQFKKSRR